MVEKSVVYPLPPRDLSHSLSSFDLMNKNCRGLVQIILFPFLWPHELAKFAALNKRCRNFLLPSSSHCVNYSVLYKSQGIDLDQI